MTKNMCYTAKAARTTQKLRQAPVVLENQRLMFRELTTLLSHFSDGLTRWRDSWRHQLTTPSLDDGTTVTSGLTYIVEAVGAMAASHSRLSTELTQRVVEPLTEWPKSNFRRNWFGRLKDATEFEEECAAAQAPLLDAVKKMEKANRRYHEVKTKVDRCAEDRVSNGAKGEAKLAKWREEVKLARLAYNNAAMGVTFCQRQCRQRVGVAYAKVSLGSGCSRCCCCCRRYLLCILCPFNFSFLLFPLILYF